MKLDGWCWGWLVRELEGRGLAVRRMEAGYSHYDGLVIGESDGALYFGVINESWILCTKDTGDFVVDVLSPAASLPEVANRIHLHYLRRTA